MRTQLLPLLLCQVKGRVLIARQSKQDLPLMLMLSNLSMMLAAEWKGADDAPPIGTAREFSLLAAAQ